MSIDVQPQQSIVRHTPGTVSRLKFTVRSVDLPTLDVVARVQVTGSTPPEWADAITVDRPGRSIPSGGTDEFIVTIDLPAGTPADQYPFELRVASQASGVEVFGVSPPVAVEIAATAPPRPPRWRLWVAITVACLLVLGIGLGVYRLVAGSPAPPEVPTTTDPVEQWATTTLIDRAEIQHPFYGDDAAVSVPGGQGLTMIEEDSQLFIGYAGGITTGPAGADGEACLDSLRDGWAQRVPIPVDGRVLCLDTGLNDAVGVVRLHEITIGGVWVSVERWER